MYSVTWKKKNKLHYWVMLSCLYFDVLFSGLHKVKGETGGLRCRQKAVSKVKTVVSF